MLHAPLARAYRAAELGHFDEAIGVQRGVPTPPAARATAATCEEWKRISGSASAGSRVGRPGRTTIRSTGRGRRSPALAGATAG